MRGRHFSRFGRIAAITRLARCVVPVTAAVLANPRLSQAASVTWTGNGDGSSWTDASNWTALPSDTYPGDDLTFGGGAVGTVNLLGNELANSLTFNAGFTLDPPSNTDTLSLTAGSVAVAGGVTATVNAGLNSSKLLLNGGGTLVLGVSDSFPGGASINSGALIEPNGGNFGGTVAIGAGGTLTFSGVLEAPAQTTNAGAINVVASNGSTATLNA
jgi:hypothetical protein